MAVNTNSVARPSWLLDVENKLVVVRNLAGTARSISRCSRERRLDLANSVGPGDSAKKPGTGERVAGETLGQEHLKLIDW